MWERLRLFRGRTTPFNPWWGCQRVSPGCEHCYAEAFAKRTGHDVWGKRSERRFFGDKHWAEPVKWNRQAEAEGRRHRVFCASMADVFEDRADLHDERQRLFELTEETPWLDWQLLTKRPENVARLAPETWFSDQSVEEWAGWPNNVWLGTTVEDQKRADQRVPMLLDIPAAVRFLSCEPLLEHVVLEGSWLDPNACCQRCQLLAGHPAFCRCECHEAGKVDWVIVGGESGPKHRPLNLDHARSIRDQCEWAGVPFFFKQVGGRTPTAGGDLLDGVAWHQFPEVV